MRREGTWQDFRGAVFQCEWKDFSHAMLNYTFALNIILRSHVSCELSIYMNLDKCFVLNISKKKYLQKIKRYMILNMRGTKRQKQKQVKCPQASFVFNWPCNQSTATFIYNLIIPFITIIWISIAYQISDSVLKFTRRNKIVFLLKPKNWQIKTLIKANVHTL